MTGTNIDRRTDLLMWVGAAAMAVLATSNLFIPTLAGGRLADPTTIALLVAAVLAVWTWARNRFRVGFPDAVIAVTAMTFIPGFLMAADHSYGRFKVAGLLAALAITWAGVQLLWSQAARRRFLLVLGALGALASAMLLLFGETFYGARAIFGLNPIGLSRMACLPALVGALGAWHYRSDRLRAVVLAVCAVIGLLAAVSTGSRGPAAAAVVALLAVVLLRFLPGRVSRRGWALLGGTAAVLVAVAGLAGVLSTVWRTFAAAGTGRAELWRESLLLAVDRPGGVGFGNLLGNIPIEPRASATPDVQYSHNVFLETLTEGGVLALTGLLLAVAVSGRALARAATDPVTRALFAVWVYTLVNACLSSDLVGNRMLWVMIGAGLTLLSVPSGNRPVNRQIADDRPRVVADLHLPRH